MDVNKFRREFPALSRRPGGKKLVYFDNACSVLKPRPVIRAVNAYLSGSGACAGGRSGHALSAEVEELCHEARVKTAAFLGAASPSEIAFVANTTEAMNLAAFAFPFRPGKDEVVLTAFDHHSAMLPFLEQQRLGRAKVRLALPGPGWTLDADRICSLITQRTALVVLPRASNVTGQYFPVEAVARAAHRRGAFVLADAAQYLAGARENVRAAGIDMLAFSGHKLGAPPGIGAFYCRADLLRRLGNFKVGGGTVSDVLLRRGLPEARYFADYRRFEAGIQNYAGIAGLAAAIDFISAAGQERLAAQTAALCLQARRGLEASGAVELLGPAGAAGGAIVSFRFLDPKLFAQDFNIYLNNELPGQVVCIRCGNHCAIPLHRSAGVAQSLRLSFFAYNTAAEVRVFLGALDAFLRSARRGAA